MLKLELFIFILSLFKLVSSKRNDVTSDEDASKDYDIQDMMKYMLRNYSRMLRPNYLGSATEVSIDATILTITNIDEVNMMYTLDMFFRQRWHDYRLAHNLTEKLTLIMGSKDPSDYIWVPDTVFIDSVTSNMHHVTVNNHNLNIYPDGSVFWGTRVTVSPSCPLNLKSYPMDKQVCKFDVVSYAYTSRHVTYKWAKTPGVIINELKMAQFDLDDYHTSSKEIKYVAGSYWVLTGHFHFRRLIGPSVLQIFVPTICVVIVSWISLWVKRSVVPARAALLITTLLTISAVWSSINAQLPRVNYVKAIDIFMMTSFGSIITSLIEFTVVLNTDTLLRVIKRYKKPLIVTSIPSDEEKNGFIPAPYGFDNKSNGAVAVPGGLERNKLSFRTSSRSPPPMASEPSKKSQRLTEEEKKEHLEQSDKLADSIENAARLCFPLVYSLFLVFYFPYYLYQKEKEL